MTPIIRAVDHVVVAVRDLSAASERFSMLGFDVEPGGRHEGFGTRNAVVRLGSSYLELLTVDDERRVASMGLLGTSLIELLGWCDGALAGFAVVTDSVAQARAALADDADLLGPLEMTRTEPSGRVLRWRLLIPGGTPWRRSWPMLIEWLGETPTGIPHRHPNGARRLTGLVLDVADLDAARGWYDRAGLPASDGDRVVLGDVTLRLRAAGSPVPLAVGPSEISIAVDDVEQAAALAGSAGRLGRDGAVELAPSAGLGFTIRLEPVCR